MLKKNLLQLFLIVKLFFSFFLLYEKYFKKSNQIDKINKVENKIIDPKKKNIQENKKSLGSSNISGLELDWRQFCQEEDPENAIDIDGNLRAKLLQDFDVILVSDCIYYERESS